MNRSRLAKQAALQNVPLFQTLDEQQQHDVATLLSEQTFAKGQFLFHEGDRGQELYIISAGRVRICKTSADGRELTLRMFGPGELFGEFAVLDDQPRSTDAVAMDPLTVFTLSKRAFWALLEQHFALTRRLIALLVERTRFTAGYYGNLAFFDVAERVAALLVQLTSHHAGPPAPIRLQLTQQELGSFASATREQVNRTLREFAAQGLVSLERSAVVVLDREGLRRVLGEQG